MLHLLTSQISFRSSSSQQFNDDTQNQSTTGLKENRFTLEDDNVEWIKFCKCTYKANETRKESDNPLLTKLEKLTPH